MTLDSASDAYEPLSVMLRWWAAGQRSGVATVVRTWQSSPRQPGTAMCVGPDGSVVGSVSGGCIEGAVYDVAAQVRDTGAAMLQRYGISDDDAAAVGLSCGGTVEVFIDRLDHVSFPEFDQVVGAVHDGRPVAVATLIHGDPARIGRRLVVHPAATAATAATAGSLGSATLADAVAEDVAGMLAEGTTGVRHYHPDGRRAAPVGDNAVDDVGDDAAGESVAVFVACHAPRPRMIVFGAIDLAAALARLGSQLGYRVTVCDARPAFATAARYPDADEVVVDWPHRYLAGTRTDQHTVVCVLTHDPKFDVPLLELALRTPLGYVGAMGSRRTNDARLTLLRARGVGEAELRRLHAPIGLDIGARTPAETALSVAAEIIANRRGGSGAELRRLAGPIHHGPGAAPG